MVEASDWSARWWLAGLLAAVALLCWHEIWDRDIFFHLANGRALLDHGVPLRENVFTWTRSALPFYQNPAWLFGVLIIRLYDLGGLPAVVLLKCAVLGALYGLLFLLLRKEGVAASAAAVFIFLVAMASALRFNERPEMFSFLFFGLFVWGVQLFRRGSKRILWLFPLLIIPWANLHSGCAFGLLYLGLAWTGAALRLMVGDAAPAWLGAPEVDGRRLGRLTAAVLATAAAALLTPDPLGNLRFLSQHLHVTEVVPVAEYGFPAPAIIPWFYPLLACVLLLLTSKPRVWPPLTTLPMLGFLLLAFSGVRFVPLFGIACIPVAAPPLAFLCRKIASLFGGRPGRWWPWLQGAGPLLLVAMVLAAPPVPGRHVLEINRTMTPVDAFRFLNRVGIRGNLYNSMSFGAAGMHYLYPRYRLYQTSYIQAEEDRQAEAFQAAKDPAAWQQFLDRHRIDVALIDVKYEEPSPEFFPPSRWALVFFDDVAAVFVRRGEGNADLVAQHEYRVVHPSLFFGASGSGSGASVDVARRDIALRELERAVAWSPESFLVRLIRAYYLNAVPGNEAQALEEFDRVRRLNPEVDAVWFQKGLLQVTLGNYNEAHRELSEYVRRQNADPLGYLALSGVYVLRGEEKQGIEMLRRGLKSTSGRGELYRQLGLLLREQGDLEGAEANLRMAAQEQPGNADVLNDLGVTLGMRGQIDEAVQALSRAARLRPESQEVRQNLEFALRLREEGRR
jgi:tetratricopeptide (TPR) repeat protein